MTQPRSSALAWWSALTILVSAFLLFQVQPVISKKILPWFGGSPAVWTTCVLFFQLVLLAGYAYAHWLIRIVPPRLQGPIHITVLVLALLTFPITASGYWNITPSAFWKPLDGSFPAARILLLLAAKVAAPFFVASTTGPLVQAWFAQLYPGRSPYRLYSLSNIGSLAALLSYPFLIETIFRVDTQGVLWSLGFILFAGLVGSLASIMWREAGADAARRTTVTAAEGLVAKRTSDPASPPKPDKPPSDVPPSIGLRMAWLALAALASMALLAITNHLCQDIAVVPFMWVIPLSLYLLSFIICFDNERWYLRKTFGLLTIAMILWLSAVHNYTAVNGAFEWVQRPVKGLKIGNIALPVTFSEMNDKMFDGIGWVVKKLDRVVQFVIKDRSAVKLETGETFASLDKNADGKLTADELPDPPLISIAQWDSDTDGSVTEDEFNRKAGKREPTFRLTFDAATYDFKEYVFPYSAAYMLALFLICMVCHGELVKSKPQPSYLTSFYLSISAGGALGGLFVALICPFIFKTHFELNIAAVGAVVVGWLAVLNDGRERWLKGRELLQWALVFVMVATVVLAVGGNKEEIEMRRWGSVLPQSWQTTLRKWKFLPAPDPSLVAIERNFYGTVRVETMGDEDDPYNAGLALYNGRIWHGFQFTLPERQLETSTYYVTGTGAAMAIEENPRRQQGLRVAVLGLGSGSMAAHAQAGDVFRFYEIDPKVLKVAQEQFTYLSKIPAARNAKVEVVMGDARLSMERELKEHGSLNYDVIHLDAFSGDAIPAHLLTYESFALYEQHLRKDETGKPAGIIVVHISNRYLDLEPVVYAISKRYGYTARAVHKEEEGGPTDTASDWILVTKNEEFLNRPAVANGSEPLKPNKEILWTDQFTALYQIMK